MVEGNHHHHRGGEEELREMYNKIPFFIPSMVQRSMGMYYSHVPVYTTRLILQEIEGMEEGILKVAGTVWSRLCVIPVRTTLGRYCPPKCDFQSMCRSVSKQVIPQEGEVSGVNSVSSYADKQWCFAILKRGSTPVSGPCTLVSPRKGSEVLTREVGDSLKDEMVRMGCVGVNDTVVISGLTPVTNANNKSMVTLARVVDTLCIPYTLHETNRTILQNDNLSCCYLPSQTIDVHRLVGFNTPAMLEMRDGFRRLWIKSFLNHSCYHVENEQVVRRLS